MSGGIDHEAPAQQRLGLPPVRRPRRADRAGPDLELRVVVAHVGVGLGVVEPAAAPAVVHLGGRDRVEVPDAETGLHTAGPTEGALQPEDLVVTEVRAEGVAVVAGDQDRLPGAGVEAGRGAAVPEVRRAHRAVGALDQPYGARVPHQRRPPRPVPVRRHGGAVRVAVAHLDGGGWTALLGQVPDERGGFAVPGVTTGGALVDDDLLEGDDVRRDLPDGVGPGRSRSRCRGGRA
ncbi:hypothetical protein IHE55_03930 [Streptomyces pactum]|uniref:Uncharacterized protein n=1 Tax=Streptomyces pactum TaxID=68249 RepID=A0ABS0NFM9_9ACTN|nr:hypothetical protein [Streptomyces pactum]MBH5333997.1 hypothetical protein [Streptomyces pactum]